MSASLDELLAEALFLGDLETRRAPSWTADEDAFLRAHLGYLTDAEIGEALGRSKNAVHLRWCRDLDLPAPSKTPGLHTLQGTSRLLQVDVHAVMTWVKRGMIPARVLPGLRNIQVITSLALLRFATNPLNWIYFRPDRVTEPHLRRLLDRQRERWQDEWWTPRQVADYHGVHHTDVNRYLHAGKLRGAQWGNWWILRSEATRPDLVFYKGRGAARVAQVARENHATDQFLVLAAAVGLSYSAMDRALGAARCSHYATARLAHLRRTGALVEHVSARSISFDEETGRLFADWRRHRRRFPRLAAILDAWAADDDLDGARRHEVRSVLRVWAEWFAHTPAEQALAQRLAHRTYSHARALARAYGELRERLGVDPLGPLHNGR